jgi:hypothetical protein
LKMRRKRSAHMKLRLASWVSCVLILGFLTSAYRASSPDVWRNLNVLPGRVLFETVVTKRPETIDVIVARIPVADVTKIDRWHPGWDGETLDPVAEPVAHVASVADLKSSSPLQHRIAIPPLPGGLYQVRLSTADVTAIQYLSVSSISAMLKRGARDAVVMAFDLRTMRQRRDVTAVVYAATGVRTVKPLRDGLLHFPRLWLTPGLKKTNVGGLVIVASDGSMVAFEPERFSSVLGQGTYLQTDRQIYRPGDRLYYRFISLEPATNAFLDLGPEIWSAHHATEGSFLLPPSAATGYYENYQIFVTTANANEYQIEAAPLRFVVTPGDPARFVISATRLDGEPVAGLPLYFESSGSKGPGTVRLDRWGNATVTVPTTPGSDLQLKVYGPDAHSVVAAAGVQVRALKAGINIYPPVLASPNTCYAVPIAPTNDRGAAEPNRPVVFEDWSDAALPFEDRSNVVTERKLTTGAGGYAITRWCTGATVGVYWVGARDDAARTQNRVPIQVVENRQQAEHFIWAFRDSQESAARKAVAATAVSQTDGDALVLSGSDRDFDATVVRFENGVTSFSLAPTRRLDDVDGAIYEPTVGGRAMGYINVARRPKRHQLDVAIGCLSGLKNVCVRVASAGGVKTVARLFVDVKPTSEAAIANTLNNPRAYESVYGAYSPGSDVTMLWRGGLGTPATSYLYSTANATVAPAPLPLRPISYPALVWLSGVATNRNGYAVVPLHATFFTGRFYLVHVIAVGAGGDVGEAYAWKRL